MIDLFREGNEWDMDKHSLEKNTILFTASWGKKRETTWSGTNLNILNELKKYYDIKEIDMGYRNPYFFIVSGMAKLGIISRLTKSQKLDKHFSHYFQKHYSDKNYSCFSFGIIPNQTNILNFVYQDCNYLWVNEVMRNHSANPDFINVPCMDETFVREQGEKWRQFILSPHGFLLSMNHWVIDWAVRKGIPEEKMCFIGGGINIDVSKVDRQHKNYNRFCFVGKDFKRKNGPLVVEAFKILHKKHPKTELVIAGPKDLDRKYLGEGIVSLGEISFSKVPEVFNSASVFVLPSLFEGYGLVFNEALSFGLPCIGNNCFEMPYFIQEGKNGFLLKSQNAEELASLMEKCLGNQALLDQTWNNREQVISENSWEIVGKRACQAMESWKNSKFISEQNK